MCGRFTLRTPAAVLIEHFQLEGLAGADLPLLEPRYNIAPTQDVAAIRLVRDTRQHQWAMLRWGLVPFWSKDLRDGARMINARAETVAEKPAFRRAFRQRRCLIPADGFYEWQRRGSKKQPYYIRHPEEQPLAFAGLWESWRPQEGTGPRIESCTIITTEANETVAPLHDRMPVIVLPLDYALWLDPQLVDTARIQPLLAPCDPTLLVADPVSTHVNKPANDDPQCILVQRELF